MIKLLFAPLLITSSLLVATNLAHAVPIQHKASVDSTPGHLLGGIIAYLSKEGDRQCSMNTLSAENLIKTIPAKPKGYKGPYLSKEEAIATTHQIKQQAHNSQEKALLLLSGANKIPEDINKLIHLFQEIYGEFDLMAKNCRNNTKAIADKIAQTKDEIKKFSTPLLQKVFKK